jgi:2-polyprenyl-3-methyl-5-hydroxy-6-metoxy-1,4-benzoquinol methylase
MEVDEVERTWGDALQHNERYRMQRWRDLSSDPNDPKLMELRRIAISKARTDNSIADRVTYLCELVRGKSVLDIGVVEHTRDAANSRDWLHGHLKRHAARCLGVDVLEVEVGYLREQGYDVILADITQSPLSKKFDIIIGGEVLEHLDAPGMFVKNCAAMLDPGGRLAITVPNPWYINAIVKNCFRRYTFVDSADHVAWYDASTLLELGQRHGFELERFTGIAVRGAKTFTARLLMKLRPLLIGMGLAPQLFTKSIIYEFVRV